MAKPESKFPDELLTTAFWEKIAGEFYFETLQPAGKCFLEYNMDVSKGPVYIRCLEGATTNLCYNMLDRNIQNGLADKVAYYLETHDPKKSKKLTYAELFGQVCKFANVLKTCGVKKGDCIMIFLPLCLEGVIAALGSIRIGAMHLIVSRHTDVIALSDKMADAKCKLLVTANGFLLADKTPVSLKETADLAIRHSAEVHGHQILQCITVRHLEEELMPSFEIPGNSWFDLLMENSPDICAPEWVESEHPILLSYTSGSTGKPKGLLFTTTGYMLMTAVNMKYGFKCEADSVVCTLCDISCPTGQDFGIYGGLANGLSFVMVTGDLYSPGPSRLWQIVEKYKINNIFMIAGVMRTLVRETNFHDGFNRDSLKSIVVYSDILHKETLEAFRKLIFNPNCSVWNLYGQTETCGTIINYLDDPTKIDAAGRPMLGVFPELLTETGELIKGPAEGLLTYAVPCIGMARTVVGNHARFQEYFAEKPGYYHTGDYARRDEDGYFWIVGRVDDTIKYWDKLISAVPLEKKLIQHPVVDEATIVSAVANNHDVIHCFIILKSPCHNPDGVVFEEIKDIVKGYLGNKQKVLVTIVPAFPRSRRGKVLRRILRRIANGDTDLGDLSTCNNPSVIVPILKSTAI